MRDDGSTRSPRTPQSIGPDRRALMGLSFVLGAVYLTAGLIFLANSSEIRHTVHGLRPALAPGDVARTASEVIAAGVGFHLLSSIALTALGIGIRRQRQWTTGMVTVAWIVVALVASGTIVDTIPWHLPGDLGLTAPTVVPDSSSYIVGVEVGCLVALAVFMAVLARCRPSTQSPEASLVSPSSPGV